MKVNDKSIWNEIYEKEEYTPGWTSPGTDPNLIRIIGDYLKNNNEKNIQLLDIGCGNGRNSMIVESLKNKSISYTGVDFAEKALEYCRQTYRDDKTFCHVDMTAPELPLKGPFHVIMDCGCFHSIPPENRKGYIKNLSALVNDNSLIIIGAWFRADDSTNIENPSYFPYLYLDEWFFNRRDMEDLFDENFEILSETVDEKVYEGLNKGFAYFIMKKKN